MLRIDSDAVAQMVISQFLGSLMKIERERIGDDLKSMAARAGWSPSTWTEFEEGRRPMDRPHWINANESLCLNISDVVRRLNAFIAKNPSIWVERRPDRSLTFCKRPVTSPRGLRSGKIVNIDLDAIRPHLYQELSSYFDDAVDVIATAVSLDYYGAKKTSLPASDPDTYVPSRDSEENRREYVIRIVQELQLDKLGLLERIIDKFIHYSSKDLARAYEHFSLSVKKR